MEFMPYRTEATFSEGNGDMSVEDLALSMRQDLFADSSATTSTSSGSTSGASISVHRQPGAVSLRINGVGQRYGVEGDAERIDSGMLVGRTDVEQYQQVQRHDENSIGVTRHARSSPHTRQLIEDTPYSPTPSDYHGRHIQQSPDSSLHAYGKPTDLATQQHSLSNGFARQGPAQPQLASQFYQQLRMSWGPARPASPHQQPSPAAGSNRYTVELPERSPSPLGDEPDISPRMLPKPPPEPRRGSRTRSSLRRAANLLLNRSRQSLSDGETTRRPTPPTTPRDDAVATADPKKKEGSKSQTIRERLQKNKNRMGDLLRSPNLSRVRRSSQGNVSTDSSLSPPDVYRARTGPRKYASAENLSMEPSDVTARDASRTGSRPYDVSSPRSDDNDERGPMRSQSPGYQLRRHASGPVYQASDSIEKRSLHRGYHTADSDTDSGASRVNMYNPHSQTRNSVQKAMPSARDTLRLLSKKREASNASGRHMAKSVSGPVRADHSIQPLSGTVNPARMPNDRSPADTFKTDVWTEQGARPKRSSSVESLETEDVRHEIFPDTPIRVDRDPPHDSREGRGDRYPSSPADARSEDDDRRTTRRTSRPPSRSRAPSPSRSVHFEDSHVSPDENNETEPHSRPSSRKKRSPTENSKRQKTNSTTSSRSKSSLSRGDESVNLSGSDKPSRGSRSSDYSSVDDPYSRVADRHSRTVADENPYEEIRVAGQGIGRPSPTSSSGSPLVNSWDEADSIDALYAKVEKKQRQRQRDHRSERPKETNNNETRRSSDNSGGHSEPLYATVDKTKKMKKPPSGVGQSSRRRAQSDASQIANGNPCIANDFDNSISQVGVDAHDGATFKRNMEHYSDLSGSRLSITSRASVSDKVQSIGRATKKKLTSMRRALSLDRIDTAGLDDNPQPKLKRSPSLRSLTGLFSKKDKKQSDSDSPGKLNKRRSASLSGLYVRPQRTSEGTDVTSPSHLRKVGKLLSINSDGSQIVELVKPPSGPFGFYIARGTSSYGSGVFVTRLGDGHPAKILAGLLAVGDEILDINGVDVRTRSIDDVYDMMMDNDKLTLRLVPIATRGTYME